MVSDIVAGVSMRVNADVHAEQILVVDVGVSGTWQKNVEGCNK